MNILNQVESPEADYCTRGLDRGLGSWNSGTQGKDDSRELFKDHFLVSLVDSLKKFSFDPNRNTLFQAEKYPD